MKAKNENGNIVVYSEKQFQEQFNYYNKTHLFYTLPKETLEAEGFYNVVIPEILQGEKLGAIYFDEVQKVFAYPIEQIPIPPPKTQAELQEEALLAETENYKKRTQDGADAYAKISAEFRLAKLSGVITEETQKYIESVLIPVRNEVLAGQWISAKQVLEAIGSSTIGVSLYDRLYLQITDYITLNY